MESQRQRLNALMAPARKVLVADRNALQALGTQHGWSPRLGSPASDDLHDLRWQPKGQESLFLSATHRLTHRLLALENFLDALVHLLRDHGPVFSLYPLARSAVLAAARVHAVISITDDEARAAQSLHDWLYAIGQQMRTLIAIEATEAEIAEKRRRRQSLADRYGFALTKKNRLRSKRTGRQYERTNDGDAIEDLMQPSFVDLSRPRSRGTGPLVWRLLSAFVHADPLQMLDHLEVRPADHCDDDIKSWTTTQIHGDRIGAVTLFAHNATGHLIDALASSWGWDNSEWRRSWIERTRRLFTTYLPPESGGDTGGYATGSSNP